MNLSFLGSGGAFAPISRGNSNMIVHKPYLEGGALMIDFGMTAPYIWRDELTNSFHDIDALWISHLHADHIGGLEMLAFSRYFMPKVDANGKVVKVKLYCNIHLMKELWEESLRGGLKSIEGKVMHLTDYFDCVPVQDNESFRWHGYNFQPVQTVHVVSGYSFRFSYGLLISADGEGARETFITTDTQFAPNQLRHFYDRAWQIFHDCETLPDGQRSTVHAHYEDLCTLPPEVRAKMWLYHHGTDLSSTPGFSFAGFVKKGQTFEL